MDKKELQFHSLDICNRLYNFVAKIVSEHAFKTVKLGHPVPQNLAKTKNGAMARAVHESGHKVHSRNQEVAPVCEDVKQAKYSLKRSETFASSCYSSDEQDGKELPTVQDNDATRGSTIAVFTIIRASTSAVVGAAMSTIARASTITAVTGASTTSSSVLNVKAEAKTFNA